jgi:hypothetical protein
VLRDETHTGDESSERRIHRRGVLATTGGLLGTAITAGCLSSLGFEEESARVPSLVENRPEAVYHPTHVEAMQMVGTSSAGPYTVALSYSFPHRFWNVSGEERSKVSIERNDSMHLMASLWHTETGVVVPTVTPSVEITRDGERIDERPPWSMLSQRMGFHFGDNVALPESGTYDVEVTVEPPTSRRTGSLEGGLDELESAAFELEFDPETVRSLEFTQFPDEAGSPTALEPMEMTGPEHSQLPRTEELPGEAIGAGESGDGVFALRSLATPPEGIDESGTYLAVSARTPYNRYPLALMSLSATVEHDDETRFEGPLTPTLDPGLGYHYGATVGELQPGDTLTITVDSPPGAARHEGYETAFFGMEPVSIAL